MLLAAACSSSDAAPTSTDDGGVGLPDAPLDNPVDAAPELPIVSGPISGGIKGAPFAASPLDLGRLGYAESEYFIEGEATAYDVAGTPGIDGAWTVVATVTAPYKTRLLVRRPTTAANFNGTLIVEWLNVSSGADADPDFIFAHDELLRSGYAYVGVSAQAQGVIGGGAIIVIPGAELVDRGPLKTWDSERYATLSHPGDAFSYDIFSQVGKRLRHPNGVDPLAGLTVQNVIASGESQSAARMVTYVDAVHPVASVYDGFFIHSRMGSGAALSATSPALPSTVAIRGDLAVPVLQFQTETDLFQLGFYPARQPDSPLLRTWEVAGTAHADQFLIDYQMSPIRFPCGAINTGPQHFVVSAAVAALKTWIESGVAPAAGAPLTVAGNAIALDENGNALGGVRTPDLDVPVAAHSGLGSTAAGAACFLFGKTTPFTAERLTELYPTHQQYVDKVTASARTAQNAGFILPADETIIVSAAASAPVPP